MLNEPIPDFMKNVLFILSMAFFFTSCYKEKKLEPSAPGAINTGGDPVHTTFFYSGNMDVTKYDSSFNLITTYTQVTVPSKIVGTRPNYLLSTTFNATNLKGETVHSIAVEIPSNNFSITSTTGTGIFTDGVLAGYNNKDSLYYRVLYTDPANNNKIFLDFSGSLTSSF